MVETLDSSRGESTARITETSATIDHSDGNIGDNNYANVVGSTNATANTFGSVVLTSVAIAIPVHLVYEVVLGGTASAILQAFI
jgi:hypothetical protein